MSDHFGEEGRRSMPKLDREYLERFITLLETDGSGNTANARAEPLTLHRRGHWFEPSIAHHSIGNGNITVNPKSSHPIRDLISFGRQ